MEPLNIQDGFWLAALVCVVVMVASTPIAHVLSLVYKRPPHFVEDVILPLSRSSVYLGVNCLWFECT